MIDPPLSHEDFADDEDELEIIVSLEDIERLIDKLKEEDASSTEEDDEPF
jgi:hypothetical protein